MNNISIWKSITNDDETVNTRKLVKFINKHGVNFVSNISMDLLDYVSDMTYEQIDIILSYQPKITYDHDGVEQLRIIGPSINAKILYIITKMLEYDHDFKFVSFRMEFISDNDKKKVKMTFLEFYDCDIVRKRHLWSGRMVYLNQLIDLLRNHLKRYQTLFMLMSSQID